MIHYLNETQVLFIHARLIDETGGEHGVRDLNLLKSALAHPRASFDKHDLYPDLFSKAAALMDSLVNNHPFLDGNKRTGIASVEMFLRMNGYHLIGDNFEIEQFALQVAQSSIYVTDMAEWFRAHSQFD